MHKIISTIIALTLGMNIAYSESLNKTISTLGINKSAISVSVKDIKTDDTIFSLNDRTPRLPASTLKLLTTSAAVYTLGADYIYTTSLYKSTNNDLYIKLSADPFLTSGDLDKMIDVAKTKDIAPKTFYIDDSIFDSVEWGEGWQWDDELNPLMPKFSAYNINKNLVKIDISPISVNIPPSLAVKPFYPMTFVNQIKTEAKAQNSIKISRNNSIAPNIYNIDGIVSKRTSINVPVPNPKMNFILRLEDSIRSKKLDYYSKIKTQILPKENIYLVEKVEHDITSMILAVLKNSNNMIAETLYKTAGAKWTNAQGSEENSLEMLNNYIENIGLNAEDIKVVDGSGVSKNNLMTAKFMTDFLCYKAKQEDFETFKNYLPEPGEGTLKNRMLYFKTNLKAKTGTLSDTSAIAGYITTKHGNTFAFDIMINDAKTTSSDKKNIEEQILRNIYLNY